MNIEIANRLFEMRKKRNLSQEELAEKIGVSRQAVSKWERAESSPDTDNLIQLARLYQVSLDELLFMSEPLEEPLPDGIDAPYSDASVPVYSYSTEGLGTSSGFRDEDEDEEDDGYDEDDWDDDDWDEEDWDEEDDEESDYDLTEAEKAKKRMLNSIPVPILIAATYLAIGFFANIWHPTWLIFLLVPMYYQGVAFVMAKSLRKKLNCVPVAIFATAWFFIIGFSFDVWHPTWAVFLCIPLYYSFVNALVRN